MLTTLKALRPSALAVFNHLTHGLDLGGHRKLDNASGIFKTGMPVEAEIPFVR